MKLRMVIFVTGLSLGALWVVFAGPYSSMSEADSAASSSGISDAFSRYISQ